MGICICTRHDKHMYTRTYTTLIPICMYTCTNLVSDRQETPAIHVHTSQVPTRPYISSATRRVAQGPISESIAHTGVWESARSLAHAGFHVYICIHICIYIDHGNEDGQTSIKRQKRGSCRVLLQPSQGTTLYQL